MQLDDKTLWNILNRTILKFETQKTKTTCKCIYLLCETCENLKGGPLEADWCPTHTKLFKPCKSCDYPPN
jgi:hypothetical protein